MPLKITPPIIKDFALIKADAEAAKLDPDGARTATVIRVRQAAQGERERRDEVYYNFLREYKDGEVTVTQRISYDDVARTEVMLTLADCNILNLDDKPLFTFKDNRIVSEFEFLKAWAQLPPAWADEIHEYVLEMNLLWSEPGK
jgi:hypothetical protein